MACATVISISIVAHLKVVRLVLGNARIHFFSSEEQNFALSGLNLMAYLVTQGYTLS
jgi:hypothetical protein